MLVFENNTETANLTFLYKYVVEDHWINFIFTEIWKPSEQIFDGAWFEVPYERESFYGKEIICPLPKTGHSYGISFYGINQSACETEIFESGFIAVHHFYQIIFFIETESSTKATLEMYIIINIRAWCCVYILTTYYEDFTKYTAYNVAFSVVIDSHIRSWPYHRSLR